jgi:DNA polymerase-3 subunit delta'
MSVATAKLWLSLAFCKPQLHVATYRVTSARKFAEDKSINKKIQDFEKDQKASQTPMFCNDLDASLFDIATFYGDVMMVQAGANDVLINKELGDEISATAMKTEQQFVFKKINKIMDALTNLSQSAAPLLTVEALMCVTAR